MLVYGRSREFLARQGPWHETKQGFDSIMAHYQNLRTKHGSRHDLIESDMKAFYASLDRSDPRKQLNHFFRSDDRGLFFGADISSASTSIPDYDILHPLTNLPVKKPSRGWGATEEVMLQRIAEDRVLFGPDESTIPLKKSYLAEVDSIVRTPVIYKDGRAASLVLKELFGNAVFENPKDHLVLQELLISA
jgi:adenine-specific DNA-methyltransferase